MQTKSKTNLYAGRYAPVGAIVWNAYWRDWDEVVSHNDDGSVTVKGLTGRRAGETWSHLTVIDKRDVVLTHEWEKATAPGGSVEILTTGRYGMVLDVNPIRNRSAVLLEKRGEFQDANPCEVLIVQNEYVAAINANDVPFSVIEAYSSYAAGCVLCRHMNHSWFEDCWR